MGGDRRVIPEPLLLLWYVAIAPIGGAIAAITLVALLIPTPTPSWLRGVAVMLSALCGVLVGGAVGSYAPRSLALPAAGGRGIRTVVLTIAVASAVLVGTGSPLPWILTLSAALVVTLAIAWTLHRGTG
jgi:hypothetical protein